ncbi:MAG: inorganic diphosphatase [Flavobacteriales bacterium]|nr:MAG: inorganic diphosphatase [Flavobacteriales bacterium]
MSTRSVNGHVQAVVEIPAGSSDKREYDPATRSYLIGMRNGSPRRIKYLPYPANYGFIPGTMASKSKGGDGDALDVFVLCAALPTGTVLEIEPIGIIELIDAGERDDKVIALPLDRSLLTMDVDDLEELPTGVRDILCTWLTNYDPMDGARVASVGGKAEALAAIARCSSR